MATEDDRDELGLDNRGASRYVGAAVDLASEFVPGLGALTSVARRIRSGQDERSKLFLVEACQRSGMTPNDFAGALAEDDLFQEVLLLGLKVVVVTGQQRKRARAAYVFGDAISGRVEIDESMMLMRTIDSLDEAHWAMRSAICAFFEQPPEPPAESRDFFTADTLREFVGSDLTLGMVWVPRVAPLIAALLAQGLIENTNTTFDGSPTYTVTSYASRVIDLLPDLGGPEGDHDG